MVNFKLKFNLGDWIKYGLTYGAVAGSVAAILAFFLITFIQTQLASYELLTENLARALGIGTSIGIIFISMGTAAIDAVTGRILYQLTGLKIRNQLMKFVLIMFAGNLAIGIITSLILGAGIGSLLLIFGVVVNLLVILAYTFITQKIYNMLKWRLPV